MAEVSQLAVTRMEKQVQRFRYIPRRECFMKSPPYVREFITGDKFCAGRDNGTIYLLANTPALLSARNRFWSNTPQQIPTSSESLEIIPYISSKLAERTNTMTEKINEQDKDKLLTLFSNTKKEVKSAEAFLSEMLRVLQNLFAKKPSQEISKLLTKQNNGQNIAWSYYDDNGK